jgi:uncharacterized protein (DUF2336 family)
MTKVRSAAQATGVLDELQASLTHGTVARRVELLRRVTDLFVHRASDYSEEHLSLFDDVFGCIVDHIHDEARAILAQRLAPISNAPRRIIRHLALHDLIEVAAPVLAQSDNLDDDTLIEAARSRSRDHLIAISARRALSGGVTDVLVARGCDDVVRAVASNPLAVLTDFGYDTLIGRADRSDWIATCIAMRPSMPRHHYLRLVAKASDAVRERLAASLPRDADAIDKTISALAEKARTSPTAFSEQTLISHGLVRLLYDDGRLDDRQVAQFAEARQFDEVSASLACIARIPVTLAESLMVEARDEGLFILGKVAGLTWPTLRAIIVMRTNLGHHAVGDPDDGRSVYERLRTSTAHQVLRFHRMQLSAGPV